MIITRTGNVWAITLWYASDIHLIGYFFLIKFVRFYVRVDDGRKIMESHWSCRGNSDLGASAFIKNRKTEHMTLQ